MDRFGPVDRAAAPEAERLVAQADPEHGRLVGQRREEIREDTRRARMTRAGGEHDGIRTHREELPRRPFVRPHDAGRATEPLDQLHEVVRETVVVVDHEDHAADAIMRPDPARGPSPAGRRP